MKLPVIVTLSSWGRCAFSRFLCRLHIYLKWCNVLVKRCSLCKMAWMCILTGYGDGVTGYLGATAGNGFGKLTLFSSNSICHTTSYRGQHKGQLQFKAQNRETGFVCLQRGGIILHFVWCQRECALDITDIQSRWSFVLSHFVLCCSRCRWGCWSKSFVYRYLAHRRRCSFLYKQATVRNVKILHLTWKSFEFRLVWKYVL